MQFVNRILDGLAGGNVSGALSPVGFSDFSLPLDSPIPVDTLVSVTRLILSDAIASCTQELQFRSKLGRLGIPEKVIDALSLSLFAKLAHGSFQRRRAECLPSIIGGRTLVSFDWSVQQTLASSSLDQPVSPSVLLCLRTCRVGASDSPNRLEICEDFLELNAEELDAVLAQLHVAVGAGTAVAGATLQQHRGVA